jgi:hypothetical protein
MFLQNAIRQERKQSFTYPIIENKEINIINTNMENCFVNGLPNEDIANKVVPNRIRNHSKNQLQKINHPRYNYIKIELNNFIGNPR